MSSIDPGDPSLIVPAMVMRDVMIGVGNAAAVLLCRPAARSSNVREAAQEQARADQ